MREIFYKYKQAIFRFLGAMMLVFGVVAHFWSVPKEGFSENDIAAANVARMEASVMVESNSKQKQKADASKFVEELKNTQEKQQEQFTIISIIFGVIFLLYSFILKHDSEQ
ncbi:MAG: hypothetical protein OEL19_02970 [Sulfurimonas sp.]|nr:hypothetical protein [Sulfurimonas sp.]